MTAPRKLALPLIAVLALFATFALSACGESDHETEVVEGEAVEVGELQYNAVFSRYLNRHDPEDAAYMVGQPPAPPGAGYFGVFFIVQNETGKPQPLPSTLRIVDADGGSYDSIPSESLYALPLGGTAEPDEQLPVLDSPADTGPLGGSLVLFRLPDFASENRPLILEIPGPHGGASIEIDL